ncbi:MAG: CDP-alcohol phosphatidyltransferase family protein [Bacteroides faecis]|uniref:CDP-alcohol phosphatidyltransferase n=1 Tax=Bacteroides faecis TaxID=674529 RepID=A0A6N2W2D9_9BACE|nr:CDP-alcohol phosphatidyltransferase family protein [Bacteroides faecis]
MKYSFKFIIDSLPVKKNSNSSWWVKLWVRKVSFLFTYLFINMGFSPNGVSVMSIFFVLASCICYSISTPACIWAAVVMINFWLVLDCVDGNIARCRKVKTYYGEFVDDIGGYYTVAFIYLAFGLCAYNTGGVLVDVANKWILVAGDVACICDILARLINKDYENFSRNRPDYVQQTYLTENRNSLSYIRRRVGKELGVSGAFMPMTILCAIFNAYDLMVIFYLLFNGFALLSTSVLYIYKADKYDRTHVKE